MDLASYLFNNILNYFFLLLMGELNIEFEVIYLFRRTSNNSKCEGYYYHIKSSRTSAQHSEILKLVQLELCNLCHFLQCTHSTFGTPFNDGACFVGFQYLYLTSASNYFMYMTSGQTILGFTTNLWDYGFQVVCLAQCPIGTIIFYSPTLCTDCLSIIPHCV